MAKVSYSFFGDVPLCWYIFYSIYKIKMDDGNINKQKDLKRGIHKNYGEIQRETNQYLNKQEVKK